MAKELSKAFMNISRLKNRYPLNGNIEITTFPLKKGKANATNLTKNEKKNFFFKAF